MAVREDGTIMLPAALVAELAATARTNDALQGPSFLARFHFHSLRPLIRHGLMTWGDPPEGFDRRRFAGVMVTDKGREVLASYREAVDAP